MYVAKTTRRRKPKTILGLMGFGDPVTSTTDTDPPDGSTVVGEVAARRVTCDELAADSPWKQPGQVCYPGDGSTWFSDLINMALKPIQQTASPTAPDTGMSSTKLLLLAALGGGAYYWYQQSTKGRRT